jgi:hypothetical protein
MLEVTQHGAQGAKKASASPAPAAAVDHRGPQPGRVGVPRWGVGERDPDGVGRGSGLGHGSSSRSRAHEEPTLSPAEEFDRTESIVLLLLTTSDNDRPWSVEEVIRELGDRNKAIDAIANLHAAGLVHCTGDDFVWPTRAAIRGIELAEYLEYGAPGPARPVSSGQGVR